MENFWTYTLWGNTIKDYLISICAFTITALILWLFKNVVLKRLKKVTKRTKSKIDDILVSCLTVIKWPLYLVIALWVAFKFIVISDKLNQIYNYFVIIVIVYYATRIIQELINYFTTDISNKRKEEGRATDAGIIKLINNILKVILWVVAILIVLENFGFNIKTILAGIGIGGIAIAFALQAILGDILACFSIYFDRPFDIGDYITFNDISGNVKKIGIKSTKIDSLWGEEIIVSNKYLSNNIVKNYKRMQKRRIEFFFGVLYETPIEKLKMIPDIVREVIGEIEICQVDRVHFYKIGDYSFNFDVVYYVLDPDYSKYMEVQQQINFALKERFEKENIVFAYPTQTVYLNNNNNEVTKSYVINNKVL